MSEMSKKTILVVDDAPDSILVLQETLKAQYRVKVATDGEAALKIARTAPYPDLILLDIYMPGMDGFETCRRLKQDVEGSSIPVVFMTGKERSSAESESFQAGGVDFISKPAAADVILSRVKVHLDMQEQAIRSSEIKFRRLFETAKDGILIVDIATRRVIDVNPFLVELLGVHFEEYLGNQLSDLPFLEPLAEIFRGSLQHPYPDSIPAKEETFSTLDGRRIIVEVVHTVYRVNHRDVMQINLRDITARKKAEEEIIRLNEALERRVAERTRELEYANKELEAFSYSVSHDLRAPLRAVDGFSRIALEEHAGELGKNVQPLLVRIRDGVEVMNGLISSLLSLSKVTRSDIRFLPVDMNALVESIISEIASAETMEESCFATDDLPSATGDPVLLRQVWSNLLMNAAKFTKKKGARRIEIHGVSQPEQNVYSVKDNGVGFDPKYAHKLFGVFQRLHSNEEFEGTGIGLAIVARIIRRHGGSVWAEGEEGKGATFHFALPKHA